MVGVKSVIESSRGCRQDVNVSTERRLAESPRAASFEAAAITLEGRRAPRRKTMVIVKSTFLDVVGDEDAEEEQPRMRRSSTAPALFTQHALGEAEARSSDDSPTVYVLEGVKWLKCSQADFENSSAISSGTLSALDEQGYISDSVSATPLPMQGLPAEFEVSDSATSDGESPSGGQLPFTHSRSDGSTCTLVSNHTSGSVHSLVPDPLPVSVMCMGQWYLPTPSYAAMPSVWPSEHYSAGPSVRAEDAVNKEHERTTLMLRNLPNNYTRDLVIELLDEQGFAEKYNFLYFPVDFQTGCGLGFAFVNLITHADACLMKDTLDGFRKWAIPSSKVCTVGWSGNDQQGLAANVERYRNSSVMHKSVPDMSKPVIFKGGVRMKFPCSTKKLWPPSSQHGSRVKLQGAAQR